MSVKTAATEEQVGKIHKMTTEIYSLKLEAILGKMKASPEDAEYLGDIKTIQAAGKWAEYNEIKSLTANQEEDNPLAKQLAEVKAFNMKPVKPTLTKEA
jgi:hypothetical protein